MIAIVKYNAGNTTSVNNALKRLGYQALITDDPEALMKAEKVIFPGVGEAGSAMQYLTSRRLDACLKKLSQPVLGICLGLQLMCKHSEEGDTTCMGIFDVEVKKFPSQDIVPHMGWNNVQSLGSLLLRNIPDGSDAYFVHSYYAARDKTTTGLCDYILPFTAVIEQDNFFATQFHPEKSGKVGEQILKNFLQL